MEIIKEIEERLGKYPQVRYESGDKSITVFPTSENGFDVALYVGSEDSHGPYSVFFNGWHDDFSNSDEALDCFAFGLSTECRLKEYSLGGNAYKWTIEYRENGIWIGDSTTSLFKFAFWKPKEEKYLQNNLLVLT